MVQEVYIDLYFLVNVSMDLLCLMITAALLHRQVKRLRAVAGAMLGGGYAVAALLFGFDGLFGFFLDFAVALLMCTVTFYVRKTTFGRILQCALSQTLVSMLLGGVMTALYAWLNRLELPFDALQGDGLSVWTFALLTAVASITTVRGGRLFGLSQKTKSVTVEAVLFGKTVTLHAMVDSGNLLRDPVSGKSVIVADLSRLSGTLPPALLQAYETGDFTSFLATYENARHIRPIPAHTATGDSLLFAIVPERLTLTRAGETYPADYLIAAAPLGDTARSFDAVISLG